MARRMSTGNRGGSLHKEGVYLMRIEDVEEKTSPNSGNDYLNIRYTVIKNGRPFGPSVWDIIVLNEASEWRWNQLMDALDAPEGETIDPETWLKGKEIYARVVVDDYNDEERNKVKAYLLADRAEKLMVKNGESSTDFEQASLMASDNGAKAKNRAKARSQPAELDETETMPL